ncbi:PstS family phosphate ABC transporter substrate-binding protein [Halonatronum saccharophilum]|uniref:PstS family phosphate ABC transporter substrate-binding protein n=1 Tax=Halonatronum saccharophilum TaxID=150060 RepID=UPI000552CB8B|nr:PstS family phosphate ABC transporter substrate-binding protein [Halonatronum saccharophilum]
MKSFNKRGLFALITVILVGILLVGCGSQGGDDTHIELRGSDTMVNLGQNLAEAYMERQDEVTLSVTGGGSGTGIAAMIDNRVDIANSSRAMRDSEIEQANDNGVDPFEIVIAMDGLAVFVNENVGVEKLTIDQVGAIFRGDITNWSELGGSDGEINMYGRQSNSGTYVYFRDNVVKEDFSDEVRQMNGTAQIIEGVRNDSFAIGYGGIGYTVDQNNHVVSGLNVLSMAADEDSKYVNPLDSKNVESGKYPIARPLYNYTDGNPEGAQLDYINFALSEEGQQVGVQTGFYPVSPEFREFNQRQLGN